MYVGENVVLIEAPKEIKDKLLEKIEKVLLNNSKIEDTKIPNPIG